MINPLIMVFLVIFGSENALLAGAVVSPKTLFFPKNQGKSPEALKQEARKNELKAKELSEKNKKEAKKIEQALQREADEQLKKIALEAKLKANLIKIETKRKIAEEKKKSDAEALLAKQKAELDALDLANQKELQALDAEHNAMLKDLSLITPHQPIPFNEPVVSAEKTPEIQVSAEIPPQESEVYTPALNIEAQDWKAILLEKYKENSDLMCAIILEGETKTEEKNYFIQEFTAQEKWFTNILAAAATENAPEIEALRQKAQKFETVVLAQRVADELIQKASTHCSFSESSRKQLRLMILYDLNASINPGSDAPADLTISQIKTITLKAIDALSAALAELSMTKEDKERRALAQELESLRSEITKLKEEHFAIKNKLLEKTQENVALSLDVNQSVKKNSELETQRIIENEKAATEIAQARSALEALQKELTAAEEHQKELVEKAEQEKRDLEAKANLEKQLAEEKVKKTEESLAAYKKREASLTNHMTTLSNEIVNLEVSHKQTEGELATSQGAVMAKEAQLKELLNKVVLLEKATIENNKALIDKEIIPEATRQPKTEIAPPQVLPITTSPTVSATPDPLATLAQPATPTQNPPVAPVLNTESLPSVDATATEQQPTSATDIKQKHIPTTKEESDAEALLKNMLDSLEKK